jgi:coproporphyrinogen III oxidase-like Fe-S oxidoreductase
VLSPPEQFNEGLLTGLRLAAGVNAEALALSAAILLTPTFWAEAQKLQQSGLLSIDQSTLTLTLQGRLLADYVTQKLIL